MKVRLLRLFSDDAEVVKKVDAIDRKQRAIGHDIRNVQMRIEPLRKMVEQMRYGGEESDQHHHE